MSTSGSPTERVVQRAARAEAAAWIVRLHGPHRCAELEAAFRDWLQAHPENGKQFERVTEVWDAGSSVPVPGVPRMTHWKEEPRGRERSLAAALLLLLCGLAGWITWRAWVEPSYTTGVGEQRVVRLDDGTRLSLNSGTRVVITYSDSERRVKLVRGEAFFEVAHNAARPFIVTAGDQQVVAIGTSFVVRYEAARTAITLLEGSVRVSPATDVGLTLAPGERVTFAAGGSRRLDEPKIEAVTAWRRGEVMLDSTQLEDAVAELNRYDKNTLIIDDPRIATLSISGIYHAGDSRGFAHTIAKLYGLEIIEQSNRIHLRAADHPRR
jgi:transmembrane sensor